MKFEDLKSEGLLLFECISGSHAYGLNHKDSDLDKKGVFILPKSEFYSLKAVGQLNDKNNDEVYYEVGKFIDLLYKNNPTCLEILNTPEESILFKHPLFEKIKLEYFISKKCKDTFAGFAFAQIKKAKGLNKKIVNPIDKEKKSILNFCYVTNDQGSISLQDFLKENNFNHDDCGLTNIPNMKGMFALFHNCELNYSGIIKHKDSLEVCLSSIPKGEKPLTNLFFNKDGYSVYCKEYKQYWEWVENRNEHRYQNTLEHGKNYDAKNMMHTFRLLHMAEEIAKTGSFNVKRTEDKDFLWKVRVGDFQYLELVERAETKLEKIRKLFEQSDLKTAPGYDLANKVLIEIRDGFYA